MHRCERGQRCPNSEIIDGVAHGRAIAAERGLCDSCLHLVERAISELPADYAELHLLLGHGKTVGGEGQVVRMSKEPPIPVRVHIDALQREIVAEATLWAGSVAEVLRLDWQDRNDVRDGWRLDRACRLLTHAPSAFLALRDAKHVVWECQQLVTVARDGLDGALVLLALHQRARSYTGQTRLVHRLPAPCPRCEAMALEREDGDETISCADCGRLYTWDEYEKLCMILTDRRTRAVV